MKTKILMMISGAAIFVGLVVWLAVGNQQADDGAVAGNEQYRVDDPTYAQLAKVAQTGDCNAAYTLGRHHMFFSLNMEKAVRWYRIAAKCPDIKAKNELVAVLMHTADDDAEIKRLLAEIEQTDSKLAESTRQSVAAARSLRERPSQ